MQGSKLLSDFWFFDAGSGHQVERGSTRRANKRQRISWNRKIKPSCWCFAIFNLAPTIFANFFLKYFRLCGHNHDEIWMKPKTINESRFVNSWPRSEPLSKYVLKNQKLKLKSLASSRFRLLLMRLPHFVMWADRDIFMDYRVGQNPHRVAHSEELIRFHNEIRASR